MHLACVVAPLIGGAATAQKPPAPQKRAPVAEAARVAPQGANNVALGEDRAQLRKRGETTFSEWIAASGRSRDSSWEARIDTLLVRLSAATGVPDLELTWALTNDAAPNAIAIPGGFVLIFRGMLRFVDSVATRLEPSDRVAMQRRATSMLASVVAHELAHVTLRHGDSTAVSARTRAVTEPRDPARAITGASNDVLQQQGLSRREEDEADRTGALYLVRAGYAIEGALDVMRALDAMERTRGRATRSLDNVTWLRGHPRPAARLAALEGYRAQLRARQTNLDDALTLLNADTDPQLAIALLDSVLTAFPSLAAARHARAAALQQQYIALVPVGALKMRPSTPTFTSEYLLSVRGNSKAAALLLTGARTDYERALQSEVHPYTLSALAVLDAWSGDSLQARAHAERAERASPNDADVLNNLGVVRYLAGDSRGARDAFERAVRAGGDSLPARVLFNYARVLLDLHDTESERVMSAYLLRDASSAWATLGRTLMGKPGARIDASSLGTSAPPTLGDTTAPAPFGIHLGALPAQVVAVLGEPPNTNQQGMSNVWRYADRALSIVMSPRDGVTSIAANARANDGGDFLGLKVGDSIAAVRARLGEPTEVVRDRLTFAHGTWAIVVDRKFGLISRISLQRQ